MTTTKKSTYAELDAIYDALEKNSSAVDYGDNFTRFDFSDKSFAYVYFGYHYISITVYSRNVDILAYFNNA